MGIAKVRMERVEQETLEAKGPEGHMLARVYFSYEYEGKTTSGLVATVKQTVGGNYATHPFEVMVPHIDGPSNYQALRDVIENYCRESLAQKMPIELLQFMHVTMSNSSMGQPRTYDIEVTQQ